MGISNISAQQFANQLNQTDPCAIVDLRTPAEYRAHALTPSLHLPLQELTKDSFEQLLKPLNLDTNAPVFLLCQSGMRAYKAAEILGDDCPWPLCIVDGGLQALKSQTLATQGTGKTVISLDRQVRITAGGLVLGGVLGSIWAHPNFIYLAGVVGAGLMFSGISNSCAMAHVLAKMPWNR